MRVWLMSRNDRANDVRQIADNRREPNSQARREESVT
jgi:hypothetical protein